MEEENPKAKQELAVKKNRDTQIEVLLRLPVNSLLRFKCVSKFWNSEISDAYFIRQHLKAAQQRFLGIIEGVMIQEDPKGNFLATRLNLPTMIMGPSKVDAWARNSCNGLICYRKETPNSVHLWNPLFPTVCESFVMRCSPYTCNCGVGYDSVSGDYKIVCMPEFSTSACISVCVFSVKNASRRYLSIPKAKSFQTVDMKVVYAKNCLFWLGRNCKALEGEEEHDNDADYKTDLVVYFDLAEETLNCLNIPSSCHCRLFLLKHDDSVAISSRNIHQQDEIWILEDHCGGDSSWRNLYTFPAPSYSPIIFSMDYCFTKSGELLMCCNNGVSFVDTVDGSLKDVEIEGDFERVASPIFTTAYVETLVSPTQL